ncbi:MAG: hypothetical protein ISR65_08475 [Bacteriovoracaceae bacterium]|nr:hypothetical protein [Bacteriovoracaceae bacterium]
MKHKLLNSFLILSFVLTLSCQSDGDDENDDGYRNGMRELVADQASALEICQHLWNHQLDQYPAGTIVAHKVQKGTIQVEQSIEQTEILGSSTDEIEQRYTVSSTDPNNVIDGPESNRTLTKNQFMSRCKIEQLREIRGFINTEYSFIGTNYHVDEYKLQKFKNKFGEFDTQYFRIRSTLQNGSQKLKIKYRVWFAMYGPQKLIVKSILNAKQIRSSRGRSQVGVAKVIRELILHPLFDSQ